MVEDLDDILNRVEYNSYNSMKTKKQSNLKSEHREIELDRSDLLLDINDILSLDVEEIQEPFLKAKKSKKQEKLKCCPVFVSGTNFPTGYSTFSSPRSCSALYCRNCDLKVLTFPEFEWLDGVDYLFLRTNMPNFEKVSKKLKGKPGCVAYACHCLAFTARDLCSVHLVPSLPWFCRGHFE